VPTGKGKKGKERMARRRNNGEKTKEEGKSKRTTPPLIFDLSKKHVHCATDDRNLQGM
jgi:hypothetical protein